MPFKFSDIESEIYPKIYYIKFSTSWLSSRFSQLNLLTFTHQISKNKRFESFKL